MAEYPFIYVMGDSHVRSFASHFLFVPLFIGSGKTNNFFTPELSAITRAKLLANIERLESGHDLMLVLTEPELRLWLETKQESDLEPSIGDKDETFLACCLERYSEVLLEVKTRLHGRLIVYNSVPKTDAAHNQLAQRYNDMLRAFCNENDLPFIYIWPHISHSGVLDPAYAADHVHLNEHIAPLVIDELKAQGLVPSTVPRENNFRWTYLYRFKVAQFETRIWGDARRDLESEHFTFTRLVQRTLIRVEQLIKAFRRPSVLVLNCREGFIPFNLCSSEILRIVGEDEDWMKIANAKRLQAFTRTMGIIFRAPTNERFDFIIDFHLYEYPQAERATYIKQIADRCEGVACLFMNQYDDLEPLRRAGFRLLLTQSLANKLQFVRAFKLTPRALLALLTLGVTTLLARFGQLINSNVKKEDIR